jgi:integrase
MTGDLIIAPSPDLQPAFFTPTPKAAKRVLEFFTAQISNDHTRRAYMNAARRFADWCAGKGIHELSHVQPFHVAAFIKDLQDQLSPPTVKQHLAALRMLFDWLVTGHVIDVNPAHAVRGPKYVVKKGKTSVLTADEARALLDSSARPASRIFWKMMGPLKPLSASPAMPTAGRLNSMTGAVRKFSWRIWSASGTNN